MTRSCRRSCPRSPSARAGYSARSTRDAPMPSCRPSASSTSSRRLYRADCRATRSTIAARSRRSEGCLRHAPIEWNMERNKIKWRGRIKKKGKEALEGDARDLIFVGFPYLLELSQSDHIYATYHMYSSFLFLFLSSGCYSAKRFLQGRIAVEKASPSVKCFY